MCRKWKARNLLYGLDRRFDKVQHEEAHCPGCQDCQAWCWCWDFHCPPWPVCTPLPGLHFQMHGVTSPAHTLPACFFPCPNPHPYPLFQHSQNDSCLREANAYPFFKRAEFELCVWQGVVTTVWEDISCWLLLILEQMDQDCIRDDEALPTVNNLYHTLQTCLHSLYHIEDEICGHIMCFWFGDAVLKRPQEMRLNFFFNDDVH